MKSWKKALLYGFLIWLLPFIVSIMIFPLRESARPLFESIMPVVVTLCAVFFSILYLRRVTSDFLKEGVMLGGIWFVISLVIDLVMFSSGPMKMSFASYVMDIGLTYLIIPTITIGFGYLMMRRDRIQKA